MIQIIWGAPLRPAREQTSFIALLSQPKRASVTTCEKFGCGASSLMLLLGHTILTIARPHKTLYLIGHFPVRLLANSNATTTVL